MKKCFYFFLNSSDRIFRELTKESRYINYFFADIDMIFHPRREKTKSLALFFEFIKVIPWFRYVDWIKLIKDR